MNLHFLPIGIFILPLVELGTDHINKHSIKHKEKQNDNISNSPGNSSCSKPTAEKENNHQRTMHDENTTMDHFHGFVSTNISVGDGWDRFIRSVWSLHHVCNSNGVLCYTSATH